MTLENRSWNTEEKARITSLLEEGNNVLNDIAALRDGLKETVDAVAEEYEIPKRVLNRAIRTYFKQNISEDREQVTSVEEILTIAGKM